jgi:hypothetical protein
MSGPTIRINDNPLPDVSVGSDIGSSIEIHDMNDFDLGFLGNQKKLGTPPSMTPAPGGGGGGGIGISSDDIEFVSLEDSTVSFDVKPSGPSAGDTIRIMRDTMPPSPPRPIDTAPTLNLSAPAAAPAPVPPKSGGWLSGFGFGSSAPAPAPATSEGGLRSLFGGGSGSSGAAPMETYLTPEQEMAKKTEGLNLLERMDRKGVGGTKMTMANTLEEINAEVARRKDSKGLEASLRFQRSMMTTVTSGLEFLNSKYDPLGVSLDGWSEQVNENIEDYDEIFEELYDKYKDKSKVAPEVRLVMSLGLSAAMCHITNTMFKSKMPSAADIFKRNPDLANHMMRAAAEEAVGPGFANFVSMGMPGGGAGGGAPRRSAPPAPMPMEPMMAPMGSGMSGTIPTMDPRGGIDVGTARREMRGPTGVEDILEQLNMAGKVPARSVPPSASIDADELGSVGSGMTTETMRRAGRSTGRRKATTMQPTGATLTLNV